MAEHIFVRIFQKGNATPLGDDHKVKPIPDDVADLKEKLFGDDGDYNSLCFVYDRGDGPPSESDTRLSARDPVPVAVNNEAERGLPPLRVVVPLNGEKCFYFSFEVFLFFICSLLNLFKLANLPTMSCF